MKTLLLMRHAKSDWDADYGLDHDRPLNDRGLRSARLMGRVLADEGLVPELVISSTAVREADGRAGHRGGWWGHQARPRSLAVRRGAGRGARGGGIGPGSSSVMLVGPSADLVDAGLGTDGEARRDEDRNGSRD